MNTSNTVVPLRHALTIWPEVVPGREGRIWVVDCEVHSKGGPRAARHMGNASATTSHHRYIVARYRRRATPTTCFLSVTVGLDANTVEGTSICRVRSMTHRTSQPAKPATVPYRQLRAHTAMAIRVSAKRGFTIWALQALLPLADNGVNTEPLSNDYGSATIGHCPWIIPCRSQGDTTNGFSSLHDDSSLCQHS